MFVIFERTKEYSDIAVDVNEIREVQYFNGITTRLLFKDNETLLVRLPFKATVQKINEALGGM